MSTTLSTIVVNYNAGTFLRACVESLVNCPMDIEIIVVDNASTDRSLASLDGLSEIKTIQNAANLGFATACNLGAQAATAPYLLFLNPDCYFEPGTLVKLLDAMQAQKHVGMAGGLLVNADGSEQAGGRRAIPTPWRSFVRVFGLARFAPRWPRLFFDFNLHQQALPDHPIEVEAISGACMLVSREAMIEVGSWDEGYFLHCEDLDWCMRFRQKSWKILFVPAARITHALGVCGRSRPLFVEWHKHKGMIRFYLKFFRHQYPGILMAVVMLGVWLRFTLVAGYYTAKKMQAAMGLGRG
jgi:GT2 family glycosyltransferase